jgi:hypothetical protein
MAITKCRIWVWDCEPGHTRDDMGRARVAATVGWRKTLQQDWHDYDPIALAVLFLSIGMVVLAIGIP